MTVVTRLAGLSQEHPMKKPRLMELPAHDEPQATTIHRADLAPSHGFVLEIDGRMKKQFETESDARTEALQLKSRFPMLQVKVYDAVGKTRTLVSLTADDSGEADATTNEVG